MYKYFLLVPLAVMLFACQYTTERPVTLENSYNIIPKPASLQAKEGQFVINQSTRLVYKGDQTSIQQAVGDWLNQLKNQTGFELATSDDATTNTIILELNEQIETDEGYELSVTAEQVKIMAKNPVGIFYAIQTLRQLINNGAASEGENIIPAVDISDSPRFSYRGMHMDVSRHFFGIETVKKFIDQLAYHKMNRFHWHLTDDQGWRIEIKQYPKLTEVGAYRNGTLIGHYNDQPHQFDGKRYGGFYTQEEVKEIVAYASDRFITVIPEIEMPGHAQAALAAYPELGCADEAFEVWQKWGVSENVYCPEEGTFEFLENVLDEVIALFPSEYIHIGGDECPKIRWENSKYCQDLISELKLKDEHELQSYFITRMEQYINSKGKNIIGWDEILEGGLAPNATVMSWRGMAGGIEAAKSGHDVIMTPTSHCYYDYYQSDHPDEPVAIGGLITLEKAYSLEPVPEELSAEESKHVLGAQCNLWTEYIPTEDKLEYMTFPRLCALSEVVWSPKEDRNFKDFTSRIAPHINYLQSIGINTANHFYDLNAGILPKDGKVAVNLYTLTEDAVIRYTTDGSTPDINSEIYQSPLLLESDASISAQAYQNGEEKGRPIAQEVHMHLAAAKTIALLNEPHPKYSAQGPESIINGVVGSDKRYGDNEWLGFEGTNFEAIIDLGEVLDLSEVQFRCYKGEGQWIYLPSKITVYLSEDGEEYELATSIETINSDNKIANLKASLADINKGRFIKVVADNYGEIPEGKQGAGHRAWLFIDEIVVH